MRHVLSSRIGRLGIVTALLLVSTTGNAQAPDAQRTAAAQALFDQGTALIGEGKFDAACPKLEEAAGLEPAKVGVKFRLAECYEGAGRFASAWTTYRAAESTAAAANQPERVAYAREHAAALEPRISRLTIVVDESVRSVPGLTVKRDGMPVGPGQWGTALPVDQGRHTVSVTAQKKRPWQASADVKAGAPDVTITVQGLSDEGLAPAPTGVASPMAPPTGPAPPEAPPVSSAPSDGTAPPAVSRRTVGFFVGGAGLIGLGVGAAFGIKSMSKKSDADGECQFAGGTCTHDGAVLRDEAVAAGNVSTIAFVAGGVFTAAGVVLVLTAPDPSSSGVAMQVVPGRVEVVGRW